MAACSAGASSGFVAMRQFACPQAQHAPEQKRYAARAKFRIASLDNLHPILPTCTCLDWPPDSLEWEGPEG